jgi:hypothetical protein
MTLKTAEEILALDDLVKEVIDVPEWGCSVIISTMTLAQKEEWARSTAGIADEKDKHLATVRLVVATARKEDGTPLFTHEHVQKLAGKSSLAIEKLGEAALRINKLRAEDKAAATGN